jgi:hypothetical protein
VAAAGTGEPCAFPEHLKRRTYTATIEQDGEKLQVSLSGGAIDPAGNRFSAKVTPSGDVTFGMRPWDPWDYGGPEVMERFSDGSRLYISGSFQTKDTPTGLSWTASIYDGGWILYDPLGLGSYGWGATTGCPVQSFEMVRH